MKVVYVPTPSVHESGHKHATAADLRIDLRTLRLSTSGSLHTLQARLDAARPDARAK